MSNELSTTENTAIATADAAMDIPTGYICTVDRSTREGAITVANALSDAMSLNDYIAEDKERRFTITGIITTPGVRSQTGEVCTNVYMVLKDGNIVFSQSEGIKRSAQQIVGLLDGDFGEGIEVSVSEKNLGGGRTLKSLHFYA